MIDLEVCEKQGYGRASKDKNNQKDKWYRYCRDKGIPFIFVWDKIKYSEIDYDIFTCDPEIFDKLTKEASDAVYLLFRKYRAGRDWHFFGQTSGNTQVLKDNVDNVIKELVNIIYDKNNWVCWDILEDS